MGGINFQRTKKINYAAVIAIEKSLLQKHFNFLKCEFKKGILYCYGKYQPTKECQTYTYRIKYNGMNSPTVTVLNPKIEYNDDIHMFPKDNSLCLYHKTDLIWNSSYHLYSTIVPWTHEWFVFYEMYKLYGVWLHPEVKHNVTKQKD
ncbi:MAG: hypothetical protein KF900_11485 [Bacteroidetes bacterium]|nr:hypothetical protein [Bacteroidota bacterium]